MLTSWLLWFYVSSVMVFGLVVLALLTAITAMCRTHPNHARDWVAALRRWFGR